MYQNLNNQQGLADAIKNVMFSLKTSQADMDDILALVKRFEAMPWDANLFSILMQSHPGEFVMEHNRLHYRPTAMNPAEILGALRVLLDQYLQVSDRIAPQPEKLYNVEQAASYLGIEKKDMLFHANQTKEVRGQVIGRSLVFTRSELDTFKQSWNDPE